jgi:hypothetical protein
MKTMIPRILIAIGLLVVVSTAHAGTTFAKKPVVVKKNPGAEISFAVSELTDVAVYVLDAKSKVVRHLVAGMLGRKAPAPLKPNSLTQTIVWDGKDNNGKLAKGGPFKVRVAIGLKPKFHSFLLYNKDAFPRLLTLAGAPGGEIYVFHSDSVSNNNQGGLKIRVYGRDGHYKRMLLPFPADLPYEKVKPMDAFQDKEGRIVPRLQNFQTLSLWPDTMSLRQRTLAAATPAADSKGGVHWMVTMGHIASLDSRGGCSYKSFLGPKLWPGNRALLINDKYNPNRVAMAVGKDDRYLYFTGLSRRVKGKKWGEGIPCIHRVSLATRDKPEVFVGDLKKYGKTGKLLSAPRSLACANGFLYIADPPAGRVVAFSEADGSLVGEIKVEAPNFLGVDAGSGAVYVVCGPKVNTPSLVKFDNIKSGKEVSRVTLPASTHTKWINHIIAVDSSAKPVRIWVTVKSYQRDRFCAVDDTGTTMTVNDKFLPRIAKWNGIPQDLVMDRKRGELYVRGVSRIDDETGEIKARLFPRAQRTLGWFGYTVIPMADGSLVSLGNGQGGGLKRWTHDGKPLPWKGAPDNSPTHTGVFKSVMTLGPVGGITAHGNDFYLVSPKGKDRKGMATLLNVYGLDGKKKRTLVYGVHARSHPRVDAKGNIYLASPVKPKGRYCPKFFDKKLDSRTELKSYRNAYNYMYGSIVKFPPSGGAMYYTGDKHGAYTPADVPEEIRKKPTMEFSYASHAYGQISNGKAQGAEWMRMGFAPFSSKWGMGVVFCHCENSGFDVDPFGRVFYPNLGQFRVEVVDTNNNRVESFGHYGNQDSGGPNASVKVPEIPLAWPTCVAVSDKYAYVADSINLRIVKVKLDYEADETVKVK